MIAKEWILKLKLDGILTEGIKNGKNYLHLQTPCKINITANATRQLRDSYKANEEKGGLLVAIPRKQENVTHLSIDRVIFITNISETPYKSYSPDSQELREALNETYSGKKINSLAIHFHTHPTHSDNPINEMFNYIFQCNTSDQDKLVSDFPVSIDDLNILMPRSLVLCSGNITDRMFIGFYNGLIAPIEFELHRKEQMQVAVDKIFNDVSVWAKKGNNDWWLFGGGLVLAILIIRANKFTIPLILTLIAMTQLFINDQHLKPKYFANLVSGAVMINIP